MDNDRLESFAHSFFVVGFFELMRNLTKFDMDIPMSILFIVIGIIAATIYVFKED